MSKLLRQILKCLLELRSRISGCGFVCNALQGISEYNISINCDMTVSCNCQDDGSGILGSLDENSFEEIFFGPQANAFRESLARGRLPILACARCSELRRISHQKHKNSRKRDFFYNRSVASLEQTAEEDREDNPAVSAEGCADPQEVGGQKSEVRSENGCGECRSPAPARGVNHENGKIKTGSYFSALMNRFTVFFSQFRVLRVLRVFRGDKNYSVHNHSVKNYDPLGAPLAPAVVEKSFHIPHSTTNNSTTPTPRLPYRGLLVENTIACNLACPGCIRPEVMKVRKKTRLSLEDVRKVSELIQRLGLKKLFYFNRGEPFLSPDILDELKIIRELNPEVHIVTSTNGTLLDTDEKREAALLMDEIEFSIDGCDQKSLQKYQRGGDFERALNNLRALVRVRDERGLSNPLIEWKYVLFNWNDRPRQIAPAIRIAAAGLEPVDKLLNGSCLGQGKGICHTAEDRGLRSEHLDAATTQQPINSSTDSAAPSADVISFWPTTTPLRGISWRYRLGRLNHIGEKSWKGREIRLRPDFGCKR